MRLHIIQHTQLGRCAEYRRVDVDLIEDIRLLSMRCAECFLRSRSRYVFSIRAVMYIMYKNIVENKIIFYDTRTHTQTTLMDPAT